MSIADRLTTERPAFTTLAAPRRAGWRPAHDRRNWPDDPEMIPQDVRLFTTGELLIGTLYGKGQTLEGWLRLGGPKRRPGTGTNWAKRPDPLPWECEAAS